MMLQSNKSSVALCKGSRSPATASFSSHLLVRKPCYAQGFKKHLTTKACKDSDNGAVTSTQQKTEKKSDVYTEDMQKKMGTVLTYRHEDGINYNRIYPDLIVGSCLQTPADVDRLAEQEGVTTVLSLQEDCDMAYFNIDIAAIQHRCRERGDIKHVRFPIRDFDPYDLRLKLPRAVSKVSKEFEPGNGGTLYVHCTAGLGRAPATALAFLAWIRGIPLDEAFSRLRSIRPCSPRVEAVRAATADLLLGIEPVEATIGVDGRIASTSLEVAGLDVGWHQRLRLSPDPAAQGRLLLRRQLLPGRYVYKFVIDGGHWTYSADHPTLRDGNNTNNYLEVRGGGSLTAEVETAQRRLLAPGGEPTEEERERILDLLCPWSTRDANVRAAVEVKAAVAAEASVTK